MENPTQLLSETKLNADVTACSEQPHRTRTFKDRDIYWRRLITEQKASGMRMAHFCRQNNLSISTFKQRKYALLKESKPTPDAVENPKPKISFVPIQVNVEQPRQANVRMKEINIILRNGHRITITEAEEILPRLLEQVARLP